MSAGPAAAHRPAVRRSPSPRVPRRVSGPARGRARTVHRPAPRVATPRASAPAVALPLPRLVDVLAGLPDARWLDRLVRGRAWIAIIALALIGLVFMQVSMLKMNAGIGQSVERSAALERQNADLRATVSQLSSEERIQRAALDMGLVMPPAGDIRYLRSRGPHSDAVKAAQIMRAPSPAAEQTTLAVAAQPDTTTPPPTAAAAEAAQPQAQQPQTQTQAPATQTQPQVQQQAAPTTATAAQPQQAAVAQQPQAQTAPHAGAAVAPVSGSGQ